MLNFKLQLFLIIAVGIYFVIIINMLRKGHLDLKYTLIWFVTGIVLLIIAVFPGIIGKISELIGIAVPSNMLFVIEALFVLAILLSLTSIVSHLNEKNRRLAQSIALLEERVKRLEEEKNTSGFGMRSSESSDDE